MQLSESGFTAPITDGKGEPRPGSVAALERVKIGGVEQWLLFRGEDIKRPIVLFLHGGPGSAEIGLTRTYRGALEKHAVVVAWDQRGAGKSYGALEPRSAMTVAQFVDDVRDVARLAAEVFHQSKVILVGHDWGSVLGVLAVQSYPDLFSAYVGVGQVADMAESERRSYAWTLAQAQQKGDAAAVQKLQGLGAPPYTGDWVSKLTTERGLLAQFGGEVHGDLQDARGRLAQAINHATEYTLLDRANFYRGMLDSLRLLWPELLKVNLQAQAPALDVPVFMALGRHDREIDSGLAAAYFHALKAPSKELVWFEESGHMPYMEEPVKFNNLLIERVLPAAG